MTWRVLEGSAEEKSCQGSRRFCLLNGVMRESSWKAWMDVSFGDTLFAVAHAPVLVHRRPGLSSLLFFLSKYPFAVTLSTSVILSD